MAISAGAATAFATGEAEGWVESVLRSGATLHEWAERAPGAERLAGRGVVWAVPAVVAGPDGTSRWAVRHYRRGGALATRLGDRYLDGGRSRPEAEAAASAAARSRGIRTPAVVAGATYRSGPFYRADLVTELVADARDLATILMATPTAPEALLAAGTLVAELERARVRHADLNAKNIVLRSLPGGPTAFVVDLDRCRVLPESRSPIGASMRRRLERSLRRLGERRGRRLSEEEWAALREGFEGAP